MNRIERLKTTLLLVCLGTLLISCSKTVKFEPSAKRIRPLDTQATRIILHEDYIFAEKDVGQMKHILVRNIQSRMKSNSRFQFEFIPAGQKVPRNNSNRALVFITGDIWLHQGKTSGDRVEKVTRYKSGFNYNQSREEIERSKWNKNQLQTIISLYFIEIGSETRLLRATMTASNDNRQKVWTGNKQLSDNQVSTFYQDKELQPAHTVVKAGINITGISRALDELIKKAVNTHFNSL